MRQQTILGKRYVLGDELGKGGIGVVYVGYDEVAHRSVAVKVLRPEHTADREALARFEQEAQIARQISHENVAKVYDYGCDGDTRYIVLELLGPTLRDLLDLRKRLSPKAATNVVGQVLAGLGAAHRAGIVHRDVKPQNILFAERSGESDALRVKIVDFGIARIARARSYTVAGRFFGTVHYVSPEQATGKPVGPASDLYSAGILLYQLLTGVVPFDGEDDLAVLHRHVEEAPRPPAQLAPGISPRLEAIVLRALEKDPGRRWPDAETMRAALATYDQPPSQWPEASQTRTVPVASVTKALPAASGQARNGQASQARQPTARFDAAASRSGARAPDRPAREWIAPVGFAVMVIVAIALGLLLGFAALDLTPLAIVRPPPSVTAVPTRAASTVLGATSVRVSADAFDGGCLDDTLPSRLVGGTVILGQASTCPSAMAQLDLVSRPRGEATLRLTALNSPLGAPEVAVLVNDRQVFRGQLDLPRDGGRGAATLSLADGTLRAGRNRLEVRNLTTDAQPAAGPWIVLFGADLSWR